jgi:hypothetical protein
VYIEELSSGSRPVQPSATTDTGFVGFLTLPAAWLAGRGPARGMLVPTVEERTALSWSRALAFRSLAMDEAPSAPAAAVGGEKAPGDKAAAPKKASPSNRFQKLVSDNLPGTWDVAPPGEDNSVLMTSEKGVTLKFPVRRTLMSVKSDERGRAWDLAFGADEKQVMQLIAAHAAAQDIRHTGAIGCVDEGKKPLTIDLAAIQERMQRTAPVVHSMDGFDAWRAELLKRLFVQLLIESDPTMTEVRADVAWDTLPADARAAWASWVRAHPGMLRFELAVRGFFENGGKSAYLAMGVQAHGAAGPAKRKFLEDSFDGVASVSMLCTPGLEFGWQQAILEYAGPRGRGDLFAVLETPRHLLTRAPRGVKLDPFRWVEGDAPYEVFAMETLPTPNAQELRFGGYSADEILDRAIPRDDTGYGAAYGPWLVVDNPLSMGPHDRYVIAPPSGHVAGVIASTDLKADGGVHKAPANEQVLGVAELVTVVSDREQEALNTKCINVIRHRPMAGIRIWGARTVAADPLWRYVNVRRLFLFVERSVRDALQWAVFLPNTEKTRGTLRNTIIGFLYQLFQRGMLDGQTWQEAFQVQCNRENNGDLDVRAGLLTVDVQIRPPFPAEFIRVRFRQSPAQSEVSEG